MKKIILMIVAASMSLATFAQRSCDLKMTLLTPAASATITSGSNIAPAFSITNLGPDAMAIGDTLLAGLSVDGSAISGTTIVLIVNKSIAKDSFINLSYAPFSLTFTSAANGVRNFCAAAQFAMRTSVVADAATANNVSCNSVTLAGGSTGIGAINDIIASDINAYPNPASDKVNFDLIVDKAGLFTFEIFDITGKMVKSSEQSLSAGSQTVSFDLNGLSAGAYTSKISSENYSVITKFIIK